MVGADDRFMAIALDCARLGRGAVEPNPMVGAVLVREGVELARGWHKRFGGPHAEVECLDAAGAAGVDPRGATMYVTLEPCCAFPGKKTPACCDAIVAAGVARVVVAMLDPDRGVSGRGVEAMRTAGVEVTVGVCQAEARHLLAAYVKLRTVGWPWVICKWAQTQDGLLALPRGAGGAAGRGQERGWVSGQSARAYAHRLRGLCDGVCVGVGTVLADDPLLTNRSGTGKQPVRVVLDSRLRIPPDCRLVRTAKVSPVIVVTTSGSISANPQVVAKLCRSGVEVLGFPRTANGLDLGPLLDELGKRQWTYLLVEGGAKVLESFVLGRFADEVLVFLSPQRVGVTAEGLPRFDIAQVRKDVPLARVEEDRFGEDVMQRYLLEK